MTALTDGAPVERGDAPDASTDATVRLWLPALALAVSVVGRLVLSLTSSTGLQLADLRVYTFGAAALPHGGLYTYTFEKPGVPFLLPFTYPPFAAFVFYPLHWVPFAVLAIGWQLATIAALWGVVRLSLQLLPGTHAGGTAGHRNALLWTALAVWLEPVRTTLENGQINVFLALGALLAIRSSRWWLAGGVVGLLAGVKLTPAVTGLYFLARGRRTAAVFAAVTFAGTVALSFALFPTEARAYFATMLGDTSRIGPVSAAMNQSLRGVLSRFAGYDVGTGPLWLLAVGCAAVLCVFAWRGLARDDRLGTMIVVQLFGLLASPISWSHHWVWIVPALVWLVHGPLHRAFVGTITVAAWIALTLLNVLSVLSMQSTFWAVHYPVGVAIGATLYPAGALAILTLMIGKRHFPTRAPWSDPSLIDGRKRRYDTRSGHSAGDMSCSDRF